MLEDMAMQLIFWIEIVAILAVSAVVFGITWIEIALRVCALEVAAFVRGKFYTVELARKLRQGMRHVRLATHICKPASDWCGGISNLLLVGDNFCKAGWGTRRAHDPRHGRYAPFHESRR